VKYRVMQNPVYIDMFNSMGGSAVPMAWGETFTAVQQGTIDGLEIPLAVIDSSKYNEVTKYLSLTNHTYSVIYLLVSKRTMDKLTPDQRKIMSDSAKLAQAEQQGQCRKQQAIGHGIAGQRHDGQHHFRPGGLPQIGRPGVRKVPPQHRRRPAQHGA